MFDLFHEIHQHHGIASARSEARQANTSSRDAGRKVDELVKKLESTLMICEALWAIVKKSHELEDEDLIRLVKDIDMKDGRPDGKVAKIAPYKCGACGKTLQRGKSRCLYCGQDHNISPFER